jgi:hypothetical protein
MVVRHSLKLLSKSRSVNAQVIGWALPLRHIILNVACCVAVLVTAISSPVSGELDPAKQADVEKKLAEILHQFIDVCYKNRVDSTPCNRYVSRALREIYRIEDFKTKSGYMTTSELVVALRASSKWLQLGTADNDAILRLAQDEANTGRAVVALGPGHVALVIPGPVRTTSWGSATPNSASLAHYASELAYVGQPLSRAFKKESRNAVSIHVRD